MSNALQSENELQDLISNHRVWALSIAKKLLFSMGLPREEFDEHRSSAMLGLVEAANRYNPNCGKEFRQFAFLRVRGAVIDGIRKSSHLSVRAYQYLKALEAVQELRKQEKFDASTNNRKLSRMMKFGSNGLLAYRLATENFETLIIDESISGNPEAGIELVQQRELLHNFIAALPQEERHVIVEYYLKGKSFTDIAKLDTGKSKSWISKLHHRALNRLREQLEIKQSASRKYAG